MEWTAESDWRRLDDGYWKRGLEDEYWAALLSQGQIVALAGAMGREVEARAGQEAPGEMAEPAGGERPADELWQEAQEALDREEVFTVEVSGANRGGLLVDWHGLPGFVPASHLKIMPRQADQQERAAELQARTGEWLAVRLIEVDREQQRLVFSERAALADAESASALLSRLAPGDVCRGLVTNVTTFGAFVDLGGVEGLVHISEISWDRVRHPGDVLRPGQELDVYVVGVNPDQERIALSVKRLRPNPWSVVGDHYQVGQIIEGTVTNVVNFGAFVRIEEGLEGLIHISELAEGNFLHPRNVVREGEVVRVRVMNIDTANRRLGLSLRQAYSPGAQA